MKVVFKLNVPQQLLALAMSAAQAKTDADQKEFWSDKNFYDAGNVGGSILADAPVSTQSLVYEGITLVYRGTRHALQYGGSDALAKIKKIFGSLDEASAAVIEYETSDPHRLGLAWHECSSEQAVLARLPVEKLTALMAKRGSQTALAACNEVKCRFPRGIAQLGDKSQAWLDQVYSKADQAALRAARAF